MKNTLVRSPKASPHLRRPNQRNPVTIILGLICKDAIILASDSQTSIGENSKRCDSQKVSKLGFPNGDQALVAQSGDVTYSARAVEIMAELSVNTTPNDYRDVASLAETAMRKVKEEMRSQNLDCSMTELHEIMIRDGSASTLIVANYHDDTPYLFSIDLKTGIATKQNKWTAAGCGANVGSFLMGWFDFSEMPYSDAWIIAAFVINEVCKVDHYCHTPIWIHGLHKDGEVSVPPLNACQMIEDELNANSENMRKKWTETFNLVRDDLVKKFARLREQSESQG